ncbi:hypothetical protein EVAR_74329_1 [Eumeta japonica]|uniref:Uncharacterized protein n=1 Tax=Eumeta variegata TaxID=151549 RepID=A0A4C1SCS2_EUMVA|nr:hypothetical protein EVAR_74329_1 [Eumeta japonica]
MAVTKGGELPLSGHLVARQTPSSPRVVALEEVAPPCTQLNTGDSYIERELISDFGDLLVRQPALEILCVRLGLPLALRRM